MAVASRKLALILYSALALIWACTGTLVWLEHERALDQGQRDVANLALAFEEQSFWILSTVDQTMRTAKAEFEADPEGFRLQAFLHQHAMPDGFTVQMSLIGADGYLVDSSVGMAPEARISNYLDRAHVAIHVQQDLGGIFIGQPIVGRLSGRWSLPVSIRVNRTDGSLAGVLIMAVDPFYLSAYFHKLNLGPQGVVNIIGTDGIVRARSGPMDRTDGSLGLGQSIDDGAVMALARQMPQGVVDSVSPVDNIRRLTAFRRLRTYPLTAIVGRGAAEILAPWWNFTWRSALAALVGSLGLILLVRALERESRQRREQERDLAEANRLLRLGEQLAMVGHWRLELDTRRLTWSDEVYRIYGLRKDTVEPSMDAILAAHHPDDRGRLRELVQTALKTGSSYEMGLRIIRPGGEIRHVVTRGVVEFDNAGRAFALFGAVSDVTDRTMQEEALLVARREAEMAARAKTDFLATVSHELRTPLNAVIGFADLLLTADLPESERRRYIRLQAEAGRTLLAVINDVLDFAKVDAGHLQLDEMPTDSVGMLQTCAELVRPMAQEKGLTLRVNLASDLPPWLTLDPTRVRQIVLNLLNNAVKFTQAGTVSLLAAPVSGGDAGPMLRIAVEDTGIGIPPDRQAQLFEPFHQADASTARRYGGTGLGLAICKRLVVLMGGQIGLTSVAGRGSLFWIEVPLRESEAPAHAPALPIPSTTGDEVAAARPLHVLVAEDLPVNQLLVRAILERAGHRVDIAVDGTAAVEAVQRQPFDLVLMDVQMPGMDGLEATRVIRALPSAAGRIPIIALTANALPSEVERCRKVGMDDHIAKPIEANHLLAALSRWSQRIGPASQQSSNDPFSDVEVLSSAMQAQLEMLMGAGALLTMMQEVAASLRQRLAIATDPATPLDSVRSQAHSMVSLAGNFGLMEMSKAARAVEQAVDGGADRDALLPFLADLAAAGGRAQAALSTRLPELSAAAAAESPSA